MGGVLSWGAPKRPTPRPRRRAPRGPRGPTPWSPAAPWRGRAFAAAAAERLGVTTSGIREGLLGYRLKPHRMQVVGEHGGVTYVDDSKATNPAAVAAALASLEGPTVLILGGSEKETDFAEVLPV